MRLSNSFPGKPLLADSYLQTFALSEQGCERSLPGTLTFTGYVWSFKWQHKQEDPVSLPLCEQCHEQMRLSNSFPG